LVGSVTLSTKQLKAGMYTLRVVQDGNVEVRKVAETVKSSTYFLKKLPYAGSSGKRIGEKGTMVD